MCYKKTQFSIFTLIAIGIFLYATYLTYFNYRLSNYGSTTEAIVKTAKIYTPSKGNRFYKLTAEFTDNNRVYTTNAIETTRQITIGDKVTITYDKYHPERANVLDNNYNNPLIYWSTFFLLFSLLLLYCIENIMLNISLTYPSHRFTQTY